MAAIINNYHESSVQVTELLLMQKPSCRGIKLLTIQTICDKLILTNIFLKGADGNGELLFVRSDVYFADSFTWA